MAVGELWAGALGKWMVNKIQVALLAYLKKMTQANHP